MRLTTAANNKVVAMSAAMAKGTGLQKFSAEFPQNLYDVGIAEQHAVTSAAGMAISGMIPVVAIYHLSFKGHMIR